MQRLCESKNTGGRIDVETMRIRGERERERGRRLRVLLESPCSYWEYGRAAEKNSDGLLERGEKKSSHDSDSDHVTALTTKLLVPEAAVLMMA